MVQGPPLVAFSPCQDRFITSRYGKRSSSPSYLPTTITFYLIQTGQWEERWSTSKKRTYYFNRATGESVWDKPSDFDGQPATSHQQVKASHLLIKHKDSRRPSSWKEPVVTRSKEEAVDILASLRQLIVDGKFDFATLATQESHCSSAKKGGDLGFFGPGQMQPAFEKATFALNVGEMSGIIETDSGVHIILRTA